MATKRKTTPKRKGRKAAKHSAWKPGWYRTMELRKRHAEQVVSFWCGFLVRAVGIAFAMFVVIYALTAAYLGG